MVFSLMVITGIFTPLGFSQAALVGYLTRPWAAIPLDHGRFRCGSFAIRAGSASPYTVSPADGVVVAVKDDVGVSGSASF
jgi:hypothetical protein